MPDGARPSVRDQQDNVDNGISRELKAAEEYLKRGFSVIPIQYRDKRPAIKWEEFQNTASSIDDHRKWFSEYEEKRNVGIVTGSVSGLVVIDLDGGKEAISLLRKENLLSEEDWKTAAVQTQNGYHLYFAYSGSDIKNAVRFLHENGKPYGVDVRAEGGYVLAPPSTHPSGFKYLWLRPLNNLRPLPGALLERLHSLSTGKLSDDFIQVTDDKGDVLVEVFGGLVGEGRRDITLTRYIGTLMNMGVHDQKRLIIEGVRANKRFSPPLEYEQVVKVVKSVYKADSRKWNNDVVRMLSGDEIARYVRSRTVRRGIYCNVPGMSIIGGLCPGELIALAAPPGFGKSSYLMQVASELAKKDVKVMAFTTEMPIEEWACRVGALACSVNVNDIEQPPQKEIVEAVSTGRLMFCGNPQPCMNEIERAVEAHRPRVLLIDHFGRIDEVINQNQKMRGDLQVQQVAKRLAELADEHGMTVMVASHLSKQGYGKRPGLEDIREGLTLPHEAEAVLMFYTEGRLEEQPEVRKISLLVCKNRYGKLGVIKGVFDTKSLRFSEELAVNESAMLGDEQGLMVH